MEKVKVEIAGCGNARVLDEYGIPITQITPVCPASADNTTKKTYQVELRGNTGSLYGTETDLKTTCSTVLESFGCCVNEDPFTPLCDVCREPNCTKDICRVKEFNAPEMGD